MTIRTFPVFFESAARRILSRLYFILSPAAIVMLVGCGGAGGTSGRTSEGKLIAIATTTIVADMVKEVGGDHLDVRGLMGPGVDPHLYQPTPSDSAKLGKAGIVFYSGLFLEGKMESIFRNMAKAGRVPVHAVTENLAHDALFQPAGVEGHPDPHVWGDAKLWAQCLDVVIKGLVSADSPNAESYRKNGALYREKLLGLDNWAKERGAIVAEGNRVLITSHDAFNYFGRAYGFEVLGIQGISTASDAGTADVAKTVDLIKARRVKAIFAESSVSPKLIDAVRKDAGVSLGGELFSDAMGTPGQVETVNGESYDVGTYVGMLKHNINTVVEALK